MRNCSWTRFGDELLNLSLIDVPANHPDQGAQEREEDHRHEDQGDGALEKDSDISPVDVQGLPESHFHLGS